ncbi:ExeM/NucH family extracellular endonuclease [Cognaticolwellia mytili]|uniref:ExeM/NucH family extracellular endonuclease n=1 Tax=Cognaticolwellia mytili TaxID=1888913 RepID=UPI001F27D064|nr:ExeM/NucH family extracellular endonuclease [Cognaticolwellia mytili]
MDIFLRKNFSSIKSNLASKAVCTIFTGSVLASSVVNADEIWSENFDAANIDGKGAVFNQIDLSNVTKWSIDVSSAQLTATSDWFKVKSGKFEGRDLDGVAIWQSEEINISDMADIKLAVSLAERGNHEGTDFVDVAYAIDGGAFETITDWQGKGSAEHTLVDDFTSEVVSAVIAAGNSLVIRVSMKNNAGSEYITLDDVVVTSGAGTVEPPPIDPPPIDPPPVEPPATGTIVDACFNCPDLSKVASASDFVDSIYYADVNAALANQATASNLRSAINGAISINHNVLSYSQVWTALTQTDEDPLNSDNVILLYRGISLAKFSNGSGPQSSNPDNWNREHVWAKSHGFPSSSAAAYTDIHHLRPTDISVNSSRGNLDFDYSDNNLPEAPLNKVDSNSFEPRDVVKGDVARMTFYMDVRYEGADPQTPDLTLVDMLTSTGQARLGKLCALLAWHEADPVDTFEQERNNRIYEFQGNRNPFIDHPEWVTQVFTNACDGTTPPDPVDPVDPTPPDPVDPTPPSSNSALFISEYVEGSSFNKAIEIFNPTNSVVSLSGYQLKLYGNGNDSATVTADLSGEILASDVIVVGSTQIADDSALKPLVDITNSAVNFNGDDYIELVKDGAIVDSFGIKGVRTTWGSNTTLVRKSSVSTGDTNATDDFIVATQWDSYPSNTFSFLGSHSFDGVIIDPNPNPDPEPEPSLIGMCGDSAELISGIQGNGNASTMVGSNKVIEGVVTSAVDSLSGFFIQEEATDTDTDTATSEAIFVFLNDQGAMPIEGSLVRAKGDVKEFFNRTQLALTEGLVDCGVGPAITATNIIMPIANINDWESLEGMKVTFDQKLHVTDTFNLARFGQLSLSKGRLLIPTNIYAPGSEQAIALAERNSRNIIVLDDKNNSQNPDFIPFPNGGLDYNNGVRLGDTVDNIEGILDYSFNTYRILPIQTPTFFANNARKASPTIGSASEIKVASFNVLNYFNGDGQGGGFPTARGAHTFTEFTRQSDKVVAAVAAINADVVGLMEIENDGYGELSAIADLTTKLNSVMGENTYQYVSIDAAGLGGDAIAVGILYKPATVTMAGNTATTNEVPFDFGNRQPLVQSFTSKSSGEAFTVAVNHFKSKGSCGSASGANADQNDGQACWNELRTQAATKLVSWLNSKPTSVDTDNVLIMGDLNAYGKEDPIRKITDSGYRNLMAEKLGRGAYSYTFGGKTGYLDHALASNALTALIDSVDAWHINADEPRAFDYNTERKSDSQLASYYGSDAYRASDHDPVIVSFTFSTPEVLVGDFDNDNDIDIADIRIFVGMLRAGESFDLSYDFNNDGQINALDARGLMQRCTRNRCAM